jgi:site-specific DNA-methyltransferase (adenine-specific)
MSACSAWPQSDTTSTRGDSTFPHAVLCHPYHSCHDGSVSGRFSVNPYYEDDAVTIYHGDCMEVMPSLADDSVEVVVTSPPYNMGLVPGGNGRGMYRPGANNKGGRFRDGYGVHTDDLDQTVYDEWQRACLAEMWRVTSQAVFYNHRPRVEHGRLRVPLSFDYGPGPVLRQIITWDRGTGIDVNLRAYCTRGEWVMLFAKDDFKLLDHSASGTGDVWRLGMEHGETGHPAPFPLSLPGTILRTTGAASLLDPFMGSGTSLRAAKDAGVRAIGIEIEERHCEAAAMRCGQEVLDLAS